MRVESSPVRLKSSNLSKPVLNRLPNGSIVQGEVTSNLPGKSILLLGNEKIPVKLSSNLATGSYEFQVVHEQKNIIFKVLGQKLSPNLLARYNLPVLNNAVAEKLQNVAKFILANGFSLSKNKLLKILSLLNSLDSDASLFEVIFLLTRDGKKERANLKKMRKMIISLLDRRDSFTSISPAKDVPSLSKIKKLLMELIKVEKGSPNNSEKADNDFPQINFILFPLKIADRQELIPIIFLKGGKNGDSNHIFCQLDLQNLGPVKIFLRSSFSEANGFVYCAEGFVDKLTEGLQGLDGIIVKSLTSSDLDIFQWPFELLLKMEAGSNGLDCLT